MSKKNIEQKETAIKDLCGKCNGAGNIHIGFLNKKVCGECHGHGFVHKKEEAIEHTYDWNSGSVVLKERYDGETHNYKHGA